ncbi:sugar transferase [Irregularibacter muris]|uniref:Sugar transferase n=1 Tax=Irregularibacter muris TaxID=1796619 RepID=A0AAE3HGC6_9FIRM|nr:sugar transferase [Irregularibacter muris]MCR1900087.1 sugar transferase [Irregularibacter muris]
MGNLGSESLYDYQKNLTSHSGSINNIENKVIQFTTSIEEDNIKNEDIRISINTNRYVSYYFWKGVLDRVLAVLGLIITLPIFLLVAILIKFSSRGPILFKQERIGINSKSFKIYKFRTMLTNAPNVPTNSMKNDKNYVTKIGSILRKLSIDEMPQLINILKGEMSFIGPRPMIKDHQYLIKMRQLKGIDILKPGISGLAQINGRDEITDREKFKYDQQYLEDFNIKTDIKVLIKTVSKVLRKEDISI